MKILFIGDIVGRPGREMLKKNLANAKKEHKVDFVIANYENASHGFGVTPKNMQELFSYGVDCLTGGNHSWDKKEIIPFFETQPILRPLNYPDGAKGKGYEVFELGSEKLAVVNLMGHYGMPMCNNPFLEIEKTVTKLQADGIKNIFIDFHAESTAEKRALLMLLEGRVSAIVGTHTHVGSDDLQVSNNTLYLSDVGLTGCRDNVIGMDKKAPLEHFLTGVKSHFDVPNNCKKIMQYVVFELQNGCCLDGKKVKHYDSGETTVTPIWFENK